MAALGLAVPARQRCGLAMVLAVLLALVTIAPTTAASSNSYFDATWARTDKPVAAGQVSRTWMWGPAPFTDVLSERYADSPDGARTVQYFDKSRMEITHPDGDSTSIWYVTNGLLAKELITGQRQMGDNLFVSYGPAQIDVAGDANDPNGPTYATFNGLMGNAPTPKQVALVMVDFGHAPHHPDRHPTRRGRGAASRSQPVPCRTRSRRDGLALGR
ncbi:MAG TPA: hypothetical protein VMU89_07945, partial [Thermomicrobiaceae bacterium]|nr:hypothetical protein [Thermomicrobiaceae bacterium]